MAKTKRAAAPMSTEGFREEVQKTLEPWRVNLVREGFPEKVFTDVVEHVVTIYPTIVK